MGKYSLYVWVCYSVTVVTLVITVVKVIYKYKKVKKQYGNNIYVE